MTRKPTGVKIMQSTFYVSPPTLLICAFQVFAIFQVFAQKRAAASMMLFKALQYFHE